jgi:hypothetical protein
MTYFGQTRHNIKTMAVQLAGVHNGLVGLGFTQAADMAAVTKDVTFSLPYPSSLT